MAASEHGLGRLPEFDPKSRDYPIRALIADRPPRSYTWSCPIYLDQGAEGACVGFAWTHELAARPVSIKSMTADLARNIYKSAQTIDEWPGEDYEGTSILAGAKIIHSLNYISEYRWAFGVEDLAVAVSYKGPAVVGMNWYEGMDRVDINGYIRPTGYLRGGHAILVRGYNARVRRFLLHNSWGTDWGRNGICYLSYDHMGELLADRGDACIPVIRKKG